MYIYIYIYGTKLMHRQGVCVRVEHFFCCICTCTYTFGTESMYRQGVFVGIYFFLLVYMCICTYALGTKSKFIGVYALRNAHRYSRVCTHIHTHMYIEKERVRMCVREAMHLFSIYDLSLIIHCLQFILCAHT